MLTKKETALSFFMGGKKKGKTKPHNTQTICKSQIQGLTGGQFSSLCRIHFQREKSKANLRKKACYAVCPH